LKREGRIERRGERYVSIRDINKREKRKKKPDCKLKM